MRGTVAASNAERVVRYGEHRGFVRKELHLQPRGARVPVEDMFAIWERLGRGLREPDLAIALATGARLEDLELLGFVVVTAPTVGSALETFARYGALLNDAVRWEIFLDGRHAEVRRFGSAPRTLGVRLSHETALAQAVAGVRQLCGEDIAPVSVAFRHSAPSTVGGHRAFFRCPIVYDAPFDRLVFTRDVLEAEPRGANRDLWRWLSAQADAELASLGPRPLSARVRDEIARGLEDGIALDVVAARLATSERTLRRALAKEGTSFRALADEVRREVAERLLARPDVSVTRAAFEAGFSDASAFTHACRRWFGAPPKNVARGMRPS